MKIAIIGVGGVGVNFEAAERQEMIAKLDGYKTVEGGAKSSLLVEIENNRRNEIGSLSGTIARLG